MNLCHSPIGKRKHKDGNLTGGNYELRWSNVLGGPWPDGEGGRRVRKARGGPAGSGRTSKGGILRKNGPDWHTRVKGVTLREKQEKTVLARELYQGAADMGGLAPRLYLMAHKALQKQKIKLGEWHSVRWYGIGFGGE